MLVHCFLTATLRSGYMLKDTVDFAKSVEEMMRSTLGIPLDEQVEEEPEIEESDEKEEEEIAGEEEEEESDETKAMKDEL